MAHSMQKACEIIRFALSTFLAMGNQANFLFRCIHFRHMLTLPN